MTSKRQPEAGQRKRRSSRSSLSHRPKWESRFAFFRRSIIVDGVCPILGVGIITYQTLIQSGLLPPYVVAAGLIGLPGVARLLGMGGSR